MKRILEALLFVAETPLGIPRLANLVDTSDRAAVRQALVELMGEYQERDGSFEVVEVAGGYSFRTKPQYAEWVQKLGKQTVSRLSPAALETLAAIAYKQPVLRAEVERIRGVDVGGVLRMLMEKGLVQVVGRQDLPGKPLIYGTTKRFLEVFGLNSIKDLPTMEEMEALMGDMADEAAEEEAVTQIGDGKLPLAPAGSTARASETGDDTESDMAEGDEPEAKDGDDAEPTDEGGEPGDGDETTASDGYPGKETSPGDETKPAGPEQDAGEMADEPAEDGTEAEPREDAPEADAAPEDGPTDTPRPEDGPAEVSPGPAITLVSEPGEPRLDDPPATPGAEGQPAGETPATGPDDKPEADLEPAPVITLGVAMEEPEAEDTAPEPEGDAPREPEGLEAAPAEAVEAAPGEDGAVIEVAETEAPKPERVSVGMSVDGADEADADEPDDGAESTGQGPTERKD